MIYSIFRTEMAKINIGFLSLVILLFSTQDAVSKKRSHSKGHDKIVGGYNTTIQNVPYQVYLLLKQDKDHYYQCGGSIISPDYILTAAHCLQKIKKVHVRVGSTYARSGGTVITSTTLAYHPLYDDDSTDYDVGYIHLPTPIDIDNENTKVIQIADSDYKVEPGISILLSGWGATSEDGNTTDTLMAVSLTTVSQKQCNKAYHHKITSRMFCAGEPEGGKDSCQGDSGGPAVNDNQTQIGIVSFGIGCARPGYPGVYTDISSVRDWIKENTGI